MAHNLNIVSWNANGLSSKLNELLFFLKSSSFPPNILCIQETHQSSADPIQISDYNVESNYRQDRKGGGTAIYIHKDLNYRSLTTPDNMEVTGIELLDSIHHTSFFIYSLYLPPNVVINLDDLNKLTVNKNTIILGDCNAKNPLWGSNLNDARGRKIIDFLDNNHLVCLNDGSGTRLNNNGSVSHIDLAICGSNLATSFSFSVAEDSWGSDHFPLFLCGDVNKLSLLNNATPSNFRWNLRKADFDKYRDTIDSSLYSDITYIPLEEKNLKFSEAILNAAHLSIPVLNACSNKIHRNKLVPFWTDECTNIIRLRRKAEKLFRKHRTEASRVQYRNCIQNVKNVIRSAKINYWEHYCSNLSSNSTTSSVWKALKLLKGNRTNQLPKNIFSKVNPFKSDKDMADCFISHFTNSCSDNNIDARITNLRNDVVNNTLQEISLLKSSDDKSNDLNKIFSIDELNLVLSNANLKSSAGPDKIPYVFLKELSSLSKYYLLNLINQSWREGVLPSLWKEAVITPILKPFKDSHSIDSYRPISLLNTISKVMEKMVSERLLNWLENNNLVNKFQCGFRKGHSTIDHVIRLKNEAAHSIVTGNITVAIFIDFSKAFDLLWRDGLILKLMKLNIKGICLKWIKNFLENRSNKVNIRSTTSNSMEFDNGTPQGSTLSPVLFLIMVNDFPTLSKFTSSALFADDSSLWRSGTNLAQIKYHLQEDLNIIDTWCKNWGFHINVDKTVGIIFTNKKKLDTPILTICNKIIKFDNNCTFLGVTFDSHLTWKNHIINICNRTSSVLNLMRCICGQRWGTNRKTLLCVYRALIRSVIDYGCIVYENAADPNLKLLDTVQYKALLLVTGALKGTPLSCLLAECGEKTLKMRREELILKYLIKLNLSLCNPAKEILQDLHFPQLNNKLHSKYAAIISNFYHSNRININLCVKLCNSLPTVVNVDLSLARRKDNVCLVRNSDVEVENFVMTKYICKTFVFVDGACSSNGRAGIGVYIPSLKVELSVRLKDQLSTYSAELIAIDYALDSILEYNINNPVIFSDSLNVLVDLEMNSFKCSKVIQTVLSKLNKMVNCSFVWIPSNSMFEHACADRLAKSSLSSDSFVEIPYNLVDLISLAKKWCDGQWIMEWSNYKSYRVYNTIFDLNIKGFTQSIFPRKKETLIMRLRLQSAAVQAHLHKIGLSDSDLCKTCNVPETVPHVLMNCSFHGDLSTKLISTLNKVKLKFNLSNILTNQDSQTIIYKYCSENKLSW